MPAATLSRSDERSARKLSPQKPAATPNRGNRPEPKILHQTYFKSVGTRTYAAQVKEASNGNHFIALTEGRRDEKTGELRKFSICIFSEDFEAFFKLIGETSAFVRQHPVPKEVAERQAKMWQRKRDEAARDKTPRP